MYKVLLTQINDETSKYLFASETISKVSEIMMVGFRFVSFYNKVKWTRKFSTLPLIIFVHPSIKQKHNDGNDNFDNKYPKLICKIRKQVQLCVFPCNVALHQVQI